MMSLPCIYFRLTKAWALLNYYSLSFDQILAQTRVPHAVLSDKPQEGTVASD